MINQQEKPVIATTPVDHIKSSLQKLLNPSPNKAINPFENRGSNIDYAFKNFLYTFQKNHTDQSQQESPPSLIGSVTAAIESGTIDNSISIATVLGIEEIPRTELVNVLKSFGVVGSDTPDVSPSAKDRFNGLLLTKVLQKNPGSSETQEMDSQGRELTVISVPIDQFGDQLQIRVPTEIRNSTSSKGIRDGAPMFESISIKFQPQAIVSSISP